ncbi:cobalamin-dependent protein [Loktanella sp. SALINAS62]|uniref:cobalamin B12-binding domain-containing protein n=1 Tax=Loktanella sp. SALINAS62 TaxID=2706124 RepID=UPI001B8C054B|nr:cobalamin-dependent protein [Loktanella sp. SALINAS62]MBS1302550.1 cobalamin B12-binding domain-containing protein [Loktanella sp. SALINAS62]
MGELQAAFDAEVFSRTTSLFASKRDTFPPDEVQALAGDIVRRLVSANLLGPAFHAPVIPEEDIAAFCDALTQPDPQASLHFIENRRAEGMTRQGVYLSYITAAARCLGEEWEEDRLSLLQVAYGTGHLYALMRAMRAERPSVQHHALDNRRYALFATVPGEDHGIGITVAADIFRDVGWDIDLQTGTDHEALLAHVMNTQPLFIGLSLSTEQRLDALVRLVVGMRIIMPKAIIGVAPAPNVDPERLTDLVDIDLVFEDAPSACRTLDRLVRLHRRPVRLGCRSN